MKIILFLPFVREYLVMISKSNKLTILKTKDINELRNGSNLLEVLKTKWDGLHDNSDIFRYTINNLQDRKVDKYLIQLNPDRSTKRRPPECFDNIHQKFDPNKFNFTKISSKELLFNLSCDDVGTKEINIHSLLVNVSPVSRYHSLLCPSVNKCLPQVITPESIKLVLEIMMEVNDRQLRIGFNSLCAMASVNHLHWHLLVEKNILPIEIAKCEQIKGALFCLKDYPVPAFCFDVPPGTVDEAVKNVFRLVQYCLNKSIAHNVFITKGESLLRSEEETIRVFVWPRRSSSGPKQHAAFNVAILELSGWFPIYNKEHFESVRPEDLEDELRKWRLHNFENICEEVKLLY